MKNKYGNQWKLCPLCSANGPDVRLNDTRMPSNERGEKEVWTSQLYTAVPVEGQQIHPETIPGTGWMWETETAKPGS